MGVAFYESQRLGLGLAFQEEVESRSGSSGVIRNAGPRHRVADRSAYSSDFLNLFYLDLDDVLWIPPAHQKRRPGYWIDRRLEL